MLSECDDRAMVIRCLQLGAEDFWVKPLRLNEVRNLWTRVWWRKGSAPGTAPGGDPAALGSSDDAGGSSDPDTHT